MNNSEELEFAYKVRRALDQRSDALPSAMAARLAAARELALSRKKVEVRAPASLLAGAGRLEFGRDSRSWLVRLGVAAPLLAGLMLFVGLYQYEQQSHINDIADLDAAVLADELPLSAYADHGFNAFLAKRGD
ncbi:MAG TPA: DUF3619 family protein [Burkholderiaceae bacterium]|nr:DUF3619 family protein [Burkholderiaceae bacterium]